MAVEDGKTSMASLGSVGHDSVSTQLERAEALHEICPKPFSRPF